MKRKYTNEENQIFFSVWNSFASDLYSKTRKNSHILTEMAEDCQKYGLSISSNEIKNKMKAAKIKYKQEKKEHSKTGSEPSEWDTMAEIMGRSLQEFDKSCNFETVIEESRESFFHAIRP